MAPTPSEKSIDRSSDSSYSRKPYDMPTASSPMSASDKASEAAITPIVVGMPRGR